MLHSKLPKAMATVLMSVLVTVIMAIFFPLAGAWADPIAPLLSPANLKGDDSPVTQGPVLAVQAGRSVGELLRADGTLDLASGFQGSLEVRGYRLISGPDEVPRFAPVSATGDERWAGEFNLRGMNGSVSALAVDGKGLLVYGALGRNAGAGG